jgi:hypothetical protein
MAAMGSPARSRVSSAPAAHATGGSFRWARSPSVAAVTHTSDLRQFRGGSRRAGWVGWFVGLVTLADGWSDRQGERCSFEAAGAAARPQLAEVRDALAAAANRAPGAVEAAGLAARREERAERRALGPYGDGQEAAQAGLPVQRLGLAGKLRGKQGGGVVGGAARRASLTRQGGRVAQRARSCCRRQRPSHSRAAARTRQAGMARRPGSSRARGHRRTSPPPAAAASGTFTRSGAPAPPASRAAAHAGPRMTACRRSAAAPGPWAASSSAQPGSSWVKATTLCGVFE